MVARQYKDKSVLVIPSISPKILKLKPKLNATSTDGSAGQLIVPRVCARSIK